MIVEAAKTSFSPCAIAIGEAGRYWDEQLKVPLNNNFTEIFIVVESLFEINADEWVKKLLK